MTDAGSPIESPPPSRTELPRIIGISMQRIRYEPPKLEHFESALARYPDAVEFIVRTDGPVPARGYGPALFVGDAEVHNSERIDEETWRFLEFEPERLKAGAPISWGWMKDPPELRQRTEFRFRSEDELAPLV
jgi:hypothetical protein